MKVLDIVTIVSIGVLIGVEFAVSAFVNPILKRLEPRAEADATRHFAALLGQVMPFWYAFCLLGLVAESVIRHQAAGFSLLIASSGIWAAVIVLTILILVPINNRLACMDADGYNAELVEAHNRWDRLHRGRVLLLAVAMVCLLSGLN